MNENDREQLRSIVQEAVAPLRDDLTVVRADLAAVKADAAAHTRALRILQQDTRTIRSTVTGHTRVLDTLQHDVRMVRAALNDVAKESVTPGEVEAIHTDLNRVQRELAELVGRVEAIEERDAAR